MLASNSIPPTATYNQTAESQNSKQFCIENSDSRQYSYQSPISSFTDTSIVTFMETDTEDVNGNCDERCPIVKDRLFHTYDYSRELQNCDKQFEFRSVTTMTTTTIANTNHGTLYLNEFDRTTKEETISELVRATGSGQLIIQQNRLRIALGIILRLVLPLANGVARSLRGIRGLRFLRILKSLTSSRQVLTNILVYAGNTISMSLSSVHVTYRIQEPLLKMVKICKNRNGMDSIPDSPVGESVPLSLLFREPPRGSISGFTAIRAPNDAPKSVTINVIAEPPPGTPIRADVVIIHGLHGSLNNTWKQGLWNNDRHPVNFKRPPKPPVRPPKRARHSRSNIFSPPHKEKRARFVDQEYFDDAQNSDTLFSYDCVDPEEIIVCDGVECSIPIFRLRIEDRGRLLEDEKSLSSEKAQPKDEKISAPNEVNYSYCWPADWIPMDCPGVRVIAVNYTTDPYLWRPLWKKKEPRTNLVERSREMSELLIEHQVGYGHPIVWVGHSKGGLFIKQIIVDAWESGRRTAAPLWRSSRGTFFYSVPHRGAHLASIKAPLLCRSVELLDVEKNSKYLLDLHRRFVGLYQMGHLNIEVFSFVETALTLMSVLYLRIVGVDSADPGIGDVCGIQLDHREICKPRNRDCILYKELVKMIKKVC